MFHDIIANTKYWCATPNKLHIPKPESDVRTLRTVNMDTWDKEVDFTFPDIAFGLGQTNFPYGWSQLPCPNGNILKGGDYGKESTSTRSITINKNPNGNLVIQKSII